MEFFQWGSNPWGQEILIRISMDILYLAFWAGIAFILFHLVYAAVWVPKLARAPCGGWCRRGWWCGRRGSREDYTAYIGGTGVSLDHGRVDVGVVDSPDSSPSSGVEFPWLTIHWVSGVLLTVSVLYHIVHATFFLDFWSIWIGPSDIQEAVQRVKRQLGQDVEVKGHPKYPLDHRLYHLAVTLAGFAVIGTGLVMMFQDRHAAGGEECVSPG